MHVTNEFVILYAPHPHSHIFVTLKSNIMTNTLTCKLWRNLSHISTLLSANPRGASVLFTNSHLTKTRSRTLKLVRHILSNDGLEGKVRTILEELDPLHEEPTHFQIMLRRLRNACYEECSPESIKGTILILTIYVRACIQSGDDS